MILAIGSDDSHIYKEIGYALIDDDSKIIDYGVLKKYKFNDLIKLINKYKSDLVIEIQYLSCYEEDRKFERVITIRTILETLTLLNKNIIYRIYPLQWRFWIKDKFKIKGRLEREVIINTLKLFVDNKELSNSVLYAIGIGKYIINNKEKAINTIRG